MDKLEQSVLSKEEQDKKEYISDSVSKDERSKSYSKQEKKKSEKGFGINLGFVNAGVKKTKTSETNTSGESSFSDVTAENNSEYSQESTREESDNLEQETSESNSSNDVTSSTGVTTEDETKVEIFIAEKYFSLSLYSLFARFGVENLNPKFLQDFMTLPENLFSTNSAKVYQKFIKKYGTHVITASEFGGQFNIEMVSKSTAQCEKTNHMYASMF